MTNSDDPPISRRAFDASMKHALYYKALFHSMQEKLIEAEDEIVRRGQVIKQQRDLIAKLESELRIDDL